MKTRKHMTHEALIAETIGAVNQRFTPQIPDMKRCIDILIEKEYIERDKNSSNEYNYLA